LAHTKRTYFILEAKNKLTSLVSNMLASIELNVASLITKASSGITFSFGSEFAFNMDLRMLAKANQQREVRDESESSKYH
jgi:hypothetical protein